MASFLGALSVKIHERVRKTISELSALICDKCGKRIDAADTFEMQEVLSLTIHGGYAAVLGDGDVYDLDMCQECVKDVLGPYLRLRPDHMEGLSDSPQRKPRSEDD